MANVELMTPRYVLRSHLESLETTHGQRWEQTPARSVASRQLLNGEMRAPMASAFAKLGVDVEAFRVDLAHKYVVPYHQKNLVAKDKPNLVRWARGDSIAARSEATAIEQLMVAVMDETYDWPESVDVVQNDGVALAISLPDTAAMGQDYSLYDYDQKGKRKGIKTRYQRDKQGRSPAEHDADRKAGKAPRDEAYRPDKKASDKARKAERRDDQARHIPVSGEILPPTAFIPVFGPGLALDAVLVKRQWTITEILRRRWIWEGSDRYHLSPDGPALTGSGQNQLANVSSGGGGGQVEVTELYAVDYQDDDEGRPQCHPYVAYFVEGKATREIRDGNLVDAIVDLYETCGLSRLPCVLKWGSKWAHPDPDKRSMPFPIPFAQSWRAADAILTGATVALWWGGFPTLIEEWVPGQIPDYGVQDDTPDDDVVELAPMSIVRPRTGTKLVPLKLDVSSDAYRITDILLGSNEKAGPPDAASGGGGESGFQASLARAFSEDALVDIKNGCLELYAETASLRFEILTGLAKEHGPIPIQKIAKVPLGAKRDARPTREVLDLTADLAGGLYDLTAEYPASPNLARSQQLAEWASMENPLVLIEEFRKEAMNDENPEVFLARRLRQRMLDSPEMLAKLFALVAQLSGDEDEQERLRALTQQSAGQAQDGAVFPQAMAQGLDQMVPAQPVPVPLTGAGGMPNPAQSALAGALGGPIAAANQASAAGGVVPPALPLGG